MNSWIASGTLSSGKGRHSKFSRKIQNLSRIAKFCHNVKILSASTQSLHVYVRQSKFLSDKSKFCLQNCPPLFLRTNVLEGTDDERTCTECTFTGVYVERDGWKRCDLWENVSMWTIFPKSKTLTVDNFSNV